MLGYRVRLLQPNVQLSTLSTIAVPSGAWISFPSFQGRRSIELEGNPDVIESKPLTG